MLKAFFRSIFSQRRRRVAALSCAYGVFFFIVSVFFIFPLYSSAAGLVDLACGVDGRCQLCDLVSVANKLINFAIIDLAMPLAALAFGWAGLLYITSGGGTQADQARELFWKVGKGLIFVLAGWFIVNTIVRALITNQSYAPWNEIACQEQPKEPPPPPPPVCGNSIIERGETCDPPGPSCSATCQSIGPPVDDFEQNKLAAQALNARPGVRWEGGGDCLNVSGQRVGATTNRAELLAAVPVTTCSSGCSTSPIACAPTGRTPNTALLGTLDFLSSPVNNINFTITSIATGDHSRNSVHYQHRAVDIKNPSISYTQLDNLLATIPAVSRHFCEDRNGIVPCSSPGINHLHFEVR